MHFFAPLRNQGRSSKKRRSLRKVSSTVLLSHFSSSGTAKRLVLALSTRLAKSAPQARLYLQLLQFKVIQSRLQLYNLGFATAKLKSAALLKHAGLRLKKQAT